MRTAPRCMLVAIACSSFAPSQSAEAVPPTSFGPFVAYGASADSKDVVAVRWAVKAKHITTRVVQREPLGFEPAPVVYNSRQRLLYVASLRAKTPGDNKLAVFAVDKTGRLIRKSTFPLHRGCAYLSLDREGKFLLSASYFEGHVDVYKLDQQGMPEKLADTTHEGRTFAHSVRTSRDNRFVYIPYVKDNNALFQYSFDPASGKLSSLDPPQAELPKDIGPRHIAYHPSQPFVYFSNEQHLGATAYRIKENGRLMLAQVCNAGELRATTGIASSDIEITPDGRFLFVGVRDFREQDKTHFIDRYKIADDGKLTHLGHTAADAIPWGLHMSPDGRHLLVTAFHGETLTAFEISDDGDLKKRHALKWGRLIRDIATVVVPAQ